MDDIDLEYRAEGVLNLARYGSQGRVGNGLRGRMRDEVEEVPENEGLVDSDGDRNSVGDDDRNGVREGDCNGVGDGNCNGTGNGDCNEVHDGDCIGVGDGDRNGTGDGDCNGAGDGDCNSVGDGDCNGTGNGDCNEVHDGDCIGVDDGDRNGAGDRDCNGVGDRDRNGVGDRRDSVVGGVVDGIGDEEGWESDDRRSVNSDGVNDDLGDGNILVEDSGDLGEPEEEHADSLHLRQQKCSFTEPGACDCHISVNAVDIEDFRSVRDQVKVIMKRVRESLELTTGEFEMRKHVTPEKVFELFVPDHCVENIVDICNQHLRHVKKTRTNCVELKCLLRAIFTASIYSISLSRLYNDVGGFFRTEGLLDEARARVLLAAMRGPPGTKANGQYSAVSAYDENLAWSEQMFSAVNSKLLYIPGETELTCDDDVDRNRSRNLSMSSGVRQVVVPGKGTGFGISTMSEPRLNVTFSTRAARIGESASRTIEHLLMGVTRSRHPGDVSFKHQCTICTDRGCMSEKVVQCFESCGLIFAGTLKRSRSAPFDCGERRAERANCALIPEKGTRCDLWASRNGSRPKRCYLCYRESTTPNGRACMATTNCRKLGPGRWDLKPKWPGLSIEAHRERQVIKVTGVSKEIGAEAKNFIYQFESSHVTDITIAQSSDPQWFLARAGMFTSTTSLKLLKLLREVENFVVSRRSDAGVNYLLKLIGLTMGQEEQSQVPSESARSREEELGEQRLSRMSKAELLEALKSLGARGNQGRRKSWLIAKMLELQRCPPGDASAPGSNHLSHKERVQSAPVRSWCFRPVKKTEGMEVGSRSESRVLEALSGFCKASSEKKLVFMTQRGLVGSFAERHCSLATSPDGAACFDDDGRLEARALEVKTFSGAESASQAVDIR